MEAHSLSTAEKDAIQSLDISVIEAERRTFLSEESRTQRVSAERSQKSGSRFNFFKNSKNEAKNTTASTKKTVEDTVPDSLKKTSADPLPLFLVAKYLGSSSCNAYNGIAAVRKPVDSLINSVGSLKSGEDLPLMTLCVGEFGLRAEAHPLNKSRNKETLIFPIQFLSYAVQDVKFCRVFAVIFVRDPSLPTEMPECHCFACPTPTIARRLAMALAQAFTILGRRLKGEMVPSHMKMPIEMKTPDEQIDEMVHQSFA